MHHGRTQYLGLNLSEIYIPLDVHIYTLKCVTCRKDRCQLAENTGRLQQSRAALNSKSPALCRKVRPYRTEISLGNDNRVFVEIPPHCSKTGVPTPGKQKETFLALKNHSRITRGWQQSKSVMHRIKKKKKANGGFPVVHIIKKKNYSLCIVVWPWSE